MKREFILGLIAIWSSIGFAIADDISLGEPNYGGTGCPQGSAAAVLSADLKSLSLLYDEFVAEAGGYHGKTFDRKGCSLAVPIHVPEGFSVSVVSADYRGFVAVPYGGSARFSVEHFFAGDHSPISTSYFNSGEIGDFIISDNIGVISNVWSECGKDVVLRTNASTYVRTNGSRDTVIAAVDSTDMNAGIVFQLNWRSCN